MKNWINRILNLMLYLTLCVMVGTGLLIEYRLPPKNRGRLTALGMDRHEWGDWHFWAALFFLILIVAHLGMNWKWMVRIAAGMNKWKLVMGFLAGLMIIVGLVLLQLN